MIVQSNSCAAGESFVDGAVGERKHPMALRRVAREAIRYLNQIFLRRPSVEFDWLSRRWSMQFAPLDASRLAFAEVVKIDWGGAELTLRVGNALLETAMRDTLEVDHMGPVEGEVRAILVEAALADLARTVEALARKRFRLLETRAEQALGGSGCVADAGGRHGLSLSLSDGEIDYACEAWIDDLALGFLANILREWHVQPSSIEPWAGLGMPIQISVGWTTLGLGAIRRLGVHDVILLDECLVANEEDLMLIRLGGRLGIKGKLTGSTITITDWLDEIMDETDDFDDFDEPNADIAPGDGEGSELDQLPVRLNFDLGERVMTLGEIRALAPGYVIELGRDIRRSVAIRVNGKKIGEGELVDVDGYIGVSLLSITPLA